MNLNQETCQHLFWPNGNIIQEDQCARCGMTLSQARLRASPMPATVGELQRELSEARERIRELANAAIGPTSFDDAEQCVQFVIFFASRLEMPERGRFVRALGEGLRPLMVVGPTAVAPSASPDAPRELPDEPRCGACGAALSNKAYVHNPCGAAPLEVELNVTGADEEKVE